MGTAPSAQRWAARAATAEPADALKRTRRWLMIAGVLLLLGGIVAIVLPAIASVATAIFVGWLLVFASAIYVVDAFSTRDWRRTALRLMLAVLTFAAGLYLLVAPLSGTFTLTVMLVIWFVAIGIARIVIGIEERGAAGSGLLILSGTLSLVLGLMIALELPGSATWAIGLIVGIDMVFSGVQLMALAQALRTPESAMKVGHG
jgi:uncharacterized membrane protein HdeD (DUF308 family)